MQDQMAVRDAQSFRPRSGRRANLARRIFRRLARTAIALSWAAVPALACAGEVAIYEGARLIVGDGRVIEDGALVVRDGRFVEIGPSNAVVVPRGAKRIKLAGKTIMPALIEGHAHFGYNCYTDWGSSCYSRANIIKQLNMLPYYGIAAAFDPGTDPNDFIMRLIADQRAGRVGGAALHVAGGMSVPNGGPNRTLIVEIAKLQSRYPGDEIVRLASTTEEARQQVRAIKDKGYSYVKIWVTSRGGLQPKMPPEIYRPIIAYAHALGMKVVVHHETVEDYKSLAHAGVDGFLHGFFHKEMLIDREILPLIKASGAWIMPNTSVGSLQGPALFADSFFSDLVRPEVIARLRSDYEAHLKDPTIRLPSATLQDVSANEQVIPALVQAGIPIVLGSDSGGIRDYPYGYPLHRELANLVRYGMTPMQALMAGTSVSAEKLGIAGLGALKPANDASFIVLDANPLDDIANTRRINAVYLNGKKVDRDAIKARPM